MAQPPRPSLASNSRVLSWLVVTGQRIDSDGTIRNISAVDVVDGSPTDDAVRQRCHHHQNADSTQGLQPGPYHGFKAPGVSDGLSLHSGTGSTTSSRSSSRLSSLRARLAALRHTTALYPIRQQHIETSSPPPLPPPILDLLRDLTNISTDKTAVLPGIFKGSFPFTWLDNPNTTAALFLSPNDKDDASALRARHTKLQSITEQTRLCTALHGDQAEWNTLVHAPLLLDALHGHPSVHFKNITTSHILPRFRDPNPAINSIPPPTYALLFNRPAHIIPSTNPLTHFTLGDDTPAPPLAISISTATNALTARVHLAAWVRAHLLHLETLGQDLKLPALPLVLVVGEEWFIDVACRRGGETVIYQSVAVGSSGTLLGCYKISAGIRRLAAWAAEDLGGWWEGVCAGE